MNFGNLVEIFRLPPEVFEGAHPGIFGIFIDMPKLFYSE